MKELKYNTYDIGLARRRLAAFPIDSTMLWDKYINGKLIYTIPGTTADVVCKDVYELAGLYSQSEISYVGQIFSVIDNLGNTHVFQIDGDNTKPTSKKSVEIKNSEFIDDKLTSLSAEFTAKLNDESTTRKSIDDTLSANILTETQWRVNEDNKLTTALNEEIQNRLSSDADIRTALTNEATTRQNVDDNLSAAITASISRELSSDNNTINITNNIIKTASVVDDKWEQIAKTGGNFSSIYYANGLWLAGGDQIGIWKSTDGNTWSQTVKTDESFLSIHYANGLWLAGGHNDIGIWKSTDGNTWIQTAKTDGTFTSLYYENGLWLAVGTGIWKSTDGNTWIQTSKTDGFFCSLRYANGLWVACGTGIWKSTDGNTWIQTSKTDGDFRSLYYANGLWLAGTYMQGIWKSTDGNTWTQTAKTNGSFLSIHYANGLWLAAGSLVGSFYTPGIWKSTDGNTWTQTTKTDDHFWSIQYANGLWVAGSMLGIWKSNIHASYNPSYEAISNKEGIVNLQTNVYKALDTETSLRISADNDLDAKLTTALNEEIQNRLSSETATQTTINALDAQNVKLTTNQTISGLKTFTIIPEVPTNLVVSKDSQIPNKLYVDETIKTALIGGVIFKGETTVTATATGVVGPIKVGYMYVISSGTITVEGNVYTVGDYLISKVNTDTQTEIQTTNFVWINSQDSDVVKLGNTQTISGIKTFTATPSLQNLPVTQTDATNKQYVDSLNTARQNEVTALSAKLTTDINTEISARIFNDDAITSDLTKEIILRKALVDKLSAEIGDETIARKDIDTKLSAAITASISRELSSDNNTINITNNIIKTASIVDDRLEQTAKTDGDFTSIYYANGLWLAGSYGSGIWKSTDGNTWTQTAKTDGRFYSLCYANGLWVAGSDGAGIWKSTDGNTWIQTVKTDGGFQSIYYANGLWLAGASSNIGIWKSTDGNTWTQTDKTNSGVWSIYYANGLWLAGSDISGIWKSTDGNTWTQTAKTDGYFYSLYYANGLWLAGTYTGVWKSTDGNTWIQTAKTDGSFLSIHYANGLWLAGTYTGVWKSTDGNTWTQTVKTDGGFQSIYYANGLWLAGSSSNTGIWKSNIHASYNPSYETISNKEGIVNLQTNVYKDLANETIARKDIDTKLSAAISASISRELSSDNNTINITNNIIKTASVVDDTWTPTTKTTGIFRSIYYSNGLWLAGSGHNEGIFKSTDGKTWSQTSQTIGNFNGFCFARGMFLCGSNSGVWKSSDGIVWIRTQKVDDEFYSIVKFNDILVAGSVNKTGVWKSTDGNTWSQTSKTDGNFNGIYHANGLLIAVGWGDIGIWKSTDGETWTQTTKTNGSFNSIYYANGLWLAGSSDDTGIWKSTDGNTWIQTSKTDGNFSSIYYANGLWLAGFSNVPLSQGIWKSTDGNTWSQTSKTNGSFNSIYYANELWLAVTPDDNGIWTSNIHASYNPSYEAISNKEGIANLQINVYKDLAIETSLRISADNDLDTKFTLGLAGEAKLAILSADSESLTISNIKDEASGTKIQKRLPLNPPRFYTVASPEFTFVDDINFYNWIIPNLPNICLLSIIDTTTGVRVYPHIIRRGNTAVVKLEKIYNSTVQAGQYECMITKEFI